MRSTFNPRAASQISWNGFPNRTSVFSIRRGLIASRLHSKSSFVRKTLATLSFSVAISMNPQMSTTHRLPITDHFLTDVPQRFGKLVRANIWRRPVVFGTRGPHELPAQDADCRLVALRFLQNYMADATLFC